MKLGATISGGLHGVFLLAVVFGLDWFSDRDELPLTVTEIEMVDGADFEAALSTAPVVQSEGPDLLTPPAEGQSAPDDVPQPTDATETAPEQVLAEAPSPDEAPEIPDIIVPPPPTEIPTEAPRPSIAELPSPDALDNQATEPESPPSTEPVQPLASLQTPLPSSKPTPPPQPEPEPVEAEPDPQPQEPDPTEQAEPRPEPEPTEQDPLQEPELAQQPEAPEGPAPREARLPLAKPAEKAAAAEAARRQEIAAREAAEREQRQQQQARAPTQQQTQAQSQAGSSNRVQARPLSNGERNALRLGIKKYYNYGGDRSDRQMNVIIRVRLKQDGTIQGKPEKISAKGGSAGAQNALFQAGRRALIRAAGAGEFKRLPADKYGRWKTLNFRFSIDGVGKVS